MVLGLLTRFFIYGLLGWCTEIVFTGVSAAVFDRDRSATGKTYLWMHPIYGLAALALEQVHDALSGNSWLLRGLVYLLIIYVAEYSTGWALRKALGRCPWDYTGRGLNISGLVRLDYAPAWFVMGLLFEPVRVAVHAFAGSPLVQQLASRLPLG